MSFLSFSLASSLFVMSDLFLSKLEHFGYYKTLYLNLLFLLSSSDTPPAEEGGEHCFVTARWSRSSGSALCFWSYYCWMEVKVPALHEDSSDTTPVWKRRVALLLLGMDESPGSSCGLHWCCAVEMGSLLPLASMNIQAPFLASSDTILQRVGMPPFRLLKVEA